MDKIKPPGIISWEKVPFNAETRGVPAHIKCEYTAAPHMHNAGYKLIFRVSVEQAREAIAELTRLCDEIEAET
jgi:hypothetical protein